MASISAGRAILSFIRSEIFDLNSKIRRNARKMSGLSRLSSALGTGGKLSLMLAATCTFIPLINCLASNIWQRAHAVASQAANEKLQKVLGQNYLKQLACSNENQILYEETYNQLFTDYVAQHYSKLLDNEEKNLKEENESYKTELAILEEQKKHAEKETQDGIKDFGNSLRAIA